MEHNLFFTYVLKELCFSTSKSNAWKHKQYGLPDMNIKQYSLSNCVDSVPNPKTGSVCLKIIEFKKILPNRICHNSTILGKILPIKILFTMHYFKLTGYLEYPDMVNLFLNWGQC